MSGVEWWVPGALALCAAAFTAGVAILVVLAVRGVWRLFHPGGAHAAAGPVESWVPWETDPRFGSMILAEERPALDWREVAHEEDWRAQTAHDLAPATLDSGLGAGPSLAPPSPDWTPGAGHGARGEPGDGWGLDQLHETPGPRTELEPEPEVRTVAGRLVETSDEWLRRLMERAAPVTYPGATWTYAEAVAA